MPEFYPPKADPENLVEGCLSAKGGPKAEKQGQTTEQNAEEIISKCYTEIAGQMNQLRGWLENGLSLTEIDMLCDHFGCSLRNLYVNMLGALVDENARLFNVGNV